MDRCGKFFVFCGEKVRPKADCEEHGIEEGRLDVLLHKFGAVCDGGKDRNIF